MSSKNPPDPEPHIHMDPSVGRLFVNGFEITRYISDLKIENTVAAFPMREATKVVVSLEIPLCDIRPGIPEDPGLTDEMLPVPPAPPLQPSRPGWVPMPLGEFRLDEPATVIDWNRPDSAPGVPF